MEIHTANLIIGFIFIIGIFIGTMTGSWRVQLTSVITSICLYFVFGGEPLQDKIVYFGFCLFGLIMCFAAIAKYWLNSLEREENEKKI